MTPRKRASGKGGSGKSGSAKKASARGSSGKSVSGASASSKSSSSKSSVKKSPKGAPREPVAPPPVATRPPVGQPPIGTGPVGQPPIGTGPPVGTPPIGIGPPIGQPPPILAGPPPISPINNPVLPILVGGKLLPIDPESAAGALVASRALQQTNLSPQIQAEIIKALGDLLPGRPLTAGTAAADRALAPDGLAALIPGSAIIAAGFDPAVVSPPAPDVLWQNGGQQLQVQVSGVHANLSDGLVEIVVPVTCDQTGSTDISVSFVTGTPAQPAGGVATTEDHPRGAAVVVENWAEQLIAYAWQTLVTATSALASAGGSDVAGRNLITAGVEVSATGVSVTPMARHVFLAGEVQGQ